MCGEQIKGRFEERENEGSPPRVRGTEACCNRSISASGITPACAGNRKLKAKGVTTYRDHPRVCGEQTHIFVVPGVV